MLKARMLCTLFVLLLGKAAAAGWIPEVRIDSLYGNLSPGGADVPLCAVSPVNGNVYAVWPQPWDSGNNNNVAIAFAKGIRSNRTFNWTQDRTREVSPRTNALKELKPAIAVGSKNGQEVIHVAWLHRDLSGSEIDDCYYAKSTDGGDTWSAPYNVSQISPIETGLNSTGFCALAADNAGSVYVAWVDKTAGGQLDVWVRKFDGPTNSWKNKIRIDTNSATKSYFTSACIAPDGTVYIAWTDRVVTPTCMSYVYSTNGGTSWSAIQTAISNPSSNDAGASCIGVSQNGDLFGVLEDTAAGVCRFSRKPAGGSWTSPVTIPSADTFPSVVGGYTNTAYVCWNKYPDDMFELPWTGAAWGTQQNCTNTPGTSQGYNGGRIAIDLDRGFLHLVADDAVSGTHHFYATYLDLGSPIQPGTISGAVRDNHGATVSGATVTVEGLTATTSGSGAYSISIGPGTYNVTASKTGYLPQTRTGMVVTSGNTTTCDLTVTANMGTIAGYVRDAGNNPISGATVSTDTGGFSTTTIANGSYTLANVTAGTYAVTASKATYSPKTQTGVVVTVDSTTTRDFSLTGLGGISGTVRDQNGNTIGGATVSTSTGGYSTTTAANGQYSLANVAEGVYSVSASKPLYTGQTIGSVAVSRGSTTPLDLTVTSTMASCSQAKLVPENTGVDVFGKCVTAVFGSALYVEDADRASAIRVDISGIANPNVIVGDVVNVSGAVTRRWTNGVSYESQISATSVTKTGAINVLQPLMMSCKSLGGSDLGPGNPGVIGGSGPNNIGLLVRIAGTVTYRPSPTSLYLGVDDGTGIEDVSGQRGVLVYCPSAPSTISLDDIVTVTGIAEPVMPAGWTENRRYIHVRSTADVVKQPR